MPAKTYGPGPRCCAYLDDGRICGKPATHIHLQSGGMVCKEHAGIRPEDVRDRIFQRRSCWPANAGDDLAGEA